MKNKTIGILILSLLFLSCELEATKNTLTNSPTEKLIQTNSSFVNLVSITDELVSRFPEQNEGNTTLSQKITLLDTIAKNHSSFLAIMPTNFVAPTEVEVLAFLVNYEEAYNTLNLSIKMQYYLDFLIEETPEEYHTLQQTIVHDVNLTLTEKEQLNFIVTLFREKLENDGNMDGDDPSWDVRNIVAIVSGYTNSPAHAVFNLALLRICLY